MKESNGFVQEPMATSELDQEAIAEEQEANNIATVSQPESHEFSLAIKPKGTPLFKVSALYKSRLRFCIFLHFLLFLVMLTKLSEDILDRMDIFILELQELYIPKPLLWEWLWSSSIIFAMMGLNALSRNRLQSLTSYAAGTLVFSVCPLLGAAVYFFNDVSEYADMKSEANVEFWKGLPVGVWCEADKNLASEDEKILNLVFKIPNGAQSVSENFTHQILQSFKRDMTQRMCIFYTNVKLKFTKIHSWLNRIYKCNRVTTT